jgi:amino acid adenylation domain-containing protein
MFKDFISSFQERVNQFPNKPAILFNKKTITYLELDQHSDAVAKEIVAQRVNPEEIIPLILERTPEIIISMLAVLKSGGSFLPISPITPFSRIKYILEDTKAKILLTNTNVEALENPLIKIIRPSEIKKIPQFQREAKITKHNLAYVMYTSGSTGNPKGVLLEHGSMMNLFFSIISEFSLTDDEQILALTDYTFDISLIELLMPLMLGATISLTEQGTVADGAKIRFNLEKNKITLMQATPLTWEILLKHGWKNDGQMKILVGGEKFVSNLARQLDYKKGNIWNMYGPTETCMWSMFHRLEDEINTDSVPLGKPLSNTTIEILDEEKNPVAEGIQGMLYIGGAGLARGYLNNSMLTKNKFIYHGKNQERLYKTGDVVIAYDKDKICYIGRTDDQLKIGGIRIKASEIESVIEQEPFIKKAIVKVHEPQEYFKSLAAYIEIDEEKVSSQDYQGADNDTLEFLRNIYDEVYLNAKDYEYGKINNCGWQSSFTGKLFDSEELSESYNFVRNQIRESDLSNVMEVGCGTGSLLQEFIDKADNFTVVEISPRAIEYVKSILTPEQVKKVNFINDSVVNLHSGKQYSCVLINSVIQYLSSINSLMTTLQGLVKGTKPGGKIIIGDVRSLELFEIYLLEKIRRTNSDNFNLKLSSLYYKIRDAEIVVSPNFFYALKNLIAEISHVDICVKHGAFKNELNYFRYDVVLHIDKPINFQTRLPIQYDTTLNPESLHQTSLENQGKIFSINNLPNIFVKEMLVKINKEIPESSEYLAIKSDINPEKNSLQIESILKFESPYHDKFVTYNSDRPLTELEVNFFPKSADVLVREPNNMQCNLRSYCREPFNPWLQKICFDRIKSRVREHVLPWVNPSVYVWVEKWPLSINGKLDKHQLQLPTNADPVEVSNNVLYDLQRTWCNITGDVATVDDEFWCHGVSSLYMYYFLATINELFKVKINYHDFRCYNTLEKLAEHIKQLLAASNIKLLNY